jgi:hypothetical protein
MPVATDEGAVLRALDAAELPDNSAVAEKEDDDTEAGADDDDDDDDDIAGREKESAGATCEEEALDVGV